MGYTNFYTQIRDFTDQEWDAATTHLSNLVQRFPKVISELSAGPDRITFNGAFGEQCEDFELQREVGEYSRAYSHSLTLDTEDPTAHLFCKTRGLPYDGIVWSLLQYIHANTGAISSISHD